MVLFKINPVCITLFPFKGNAPWAIHMDAVSFRLPPQTMEIEPRHLQIIQYFSLIQHIQPPQAVGLQIRPDTPAGTPLE